jgi:hypothetical protein
VVLAHKPTPQEWEMGLGSWRSDRALSPDKLLARTGL